jgi:hypothetical protein
MAMAVSVWLLGIGAGQAQAAPVLTAECPGPENSGTGVTSVQRLAQTFTPSVTGDVASGEVDISKPAASSGDWTMEIFAVDSGTGIPTDPLASTTIADSTVPDGSSRIIGTFAPGVVLQSGVTYALSLSRAAAWSSREQAVGPCPGREFSSTSVTGAWVNDALFQGDIYDLIYSVYVETPPPIPTPTPAPLVSPTSTGLQAAALKRCKKRAKQHDWTKERLRKCKRKAGARPI